MNKVDVITTAPHNNSYGDSYQKAEGDIYAVSLDVARSLKRDGLVDFEEAEDAERQPDFIGTVIVE